MLGQLYKNHNYWEGSYKKLKKLCNKIDKKLRLPENEPLSGGWINIDGNLFNKNTDSYLYDNPKTMRMFLDHIENGIIHEWIKDTIRYDNYNQAVINKIENKWGKNANKFK